MPPAAPATHSPRPAVWSIQELTELVNDWCEENKITPANGQAAERLTERNVRYYRTRGLLDAPGASGKNGPVGRRGFTEKHAAQLKAVRILQARGLPLDHIEGQLKGRSLDELLAMERRELRKPGPLAGHANGLDGIRLDGQDAAGTSPAALAAGAAAAGAGEEHWLVSALGPDFLLASRRGQTISDEQRRLIVAILRA